MNVYTVKISASKMGDLFYLPAYKLICYGKFLMALHFVFQGL